MKSESKSIFCLDTSALVTMHRYYPKQMIPDLWEFVEELLSTHRIISHEFVFDEIVPETGKKDALAELISKHKGNFKPISKSQAETAAKVISMFPKLIDPMSKKNQADPWLIAMVVEMMEEVSLFNNDSKYILVSTENEKSPGKIPAACKHYDVSHMNLFQFFGDNDWQFSLARK